jgi:hypothetical protein
MFESMIFRLKALFDPQNSLVKTRVIGKAMISKSARYDSDVHRANM